MLFMAYACLQFYWSSFSQIIWAVKSRPDIIFQINVHQLSIWCRLDVIFHAKDTKYREKQVKTILTEHFIIFYLARHWIISIIYFQIILVYIFNLVKCMENVLRQWFSNFFCVGSRFHIVWKNLVRPEHGPAWYRMVLIFEYKISNVGSIFVFINFPGPPQTFLVPLPGPVPVVKKYCFKLLNEIFRSLHFSKENPLDNTILEDFLWPSLTCVTPSLLYFLWFPWFLFKINLDFLLRKIGASLNFKNGVCTSVLV
jgi:hypothetical protein